MVQRQLLALVTLCVVTINGQSTARDRDVGEIRLRTPLGTIIGNVEHAETTLPPPGRQFYSFKKIPYAEPPVQERRWTDPELVGSWTGELDGRLFGPSCPQIYFATNTVDGVEDCLHLNIFTPRLPAQARSSSGDTIVFPRGLLPVMVYIHGGGFEYWNSAVHGANKLMREDIVLVTFNYRLGALGFLSSGDKTIPGNFGLLDQLTVLKWVAANIRFFGGDPDKVTLFGTSAGAASAHLLVLSPQARGYFRGAILQSGSGLCAWSLETNPRSVFNKFLSKINCDEADNMEETIKCIKNKTTEQVLKAQLQIQSLKTFPAIRLVPVVDKYRDNPVLPAKPKKLMESGNYTHIPLIIGMAANEGVFFALFTGLELTEMKASAFRSESQVRHKVRRMVRAMTDDPIMTEEVINSILNYYLDDVNVFDAEEVYRALSDLIGDGTFGNCISQTLKMHSNSSNVPVYAYILGHRGGPSVMMSQIRQLQKQGISTPFFHKAVSHGDESLYLFSITGDFGQFSVQDRQVSEYITKLWAAFATSGTPSGGVVSPWHPVRHNGEMTYFNISANPGVMIGDYRKGETNFWSKTLPYIHELSSEMADDRDTYCVVMWVFVGLTVLLLIVLAGGALYVAKSKRTGSYPKSGRILGQS